MDWIRWIALLQPIILSLALVFFRPQWVGLLQENKDTYAIPNSDILEIQEKLKYLEDNALSGKNLAGLEESISDLYKSTRELQEQARKYSNREGLVNCDGSKTNIGVAALALIQLLVVVCSVILWRRVLALQATQKENVADLKINNNMKSLAT